MARGRGTRRSAIRPGVTHHDIPFGEKYDEIYCVLDAPNAEAIDKHHAKVGIKCDWIHEVRSTRG